MMHNPAGIINKGCNRNHSRFKIAGGISGMKVSWQITGIHKDPWANAHRNTLRKISQIKSEITTCIQISTVNRQTREFAACLFQKK
jgi:hypothetical protein